MSMARSLAIGTMGFTVASLAVFGFWAAAGRVVYRSLGEAGFYAVCAALFIVLGSILLRRLAQASLPRFMLIFSAAFAAYAVCWCLAWFLLDGRAREWVGSLAGSVALCAVVCGVFSAWRALAVTAAVAFVAHSAGYYLGSYAYDLLRSQSGLNAKLAWGLFYGLGMGAALGFVFWKAGSTKLTPAKDAI